MTFFNALRTSFADGPLLSKLILIDPEIPFDFGCAGKHSFAIPPIPCQVQPCECDYYRPTTRCLNAYPTGVATSTMFCRHRRRVSMGRGSKASTWCPWHYQTRPTPHVTPATRCSHTATIPATNKLTYLANYPPPGCSTYRPQSCSIVSQWHRSYVCQFALQMYIFAT